MKMMNNQMKEIGYDAKKMPLGKLAKSSIMKGYEALKGLMDEFWTYSGGTGDAERKWTKH